MTSVAGDDVGKTAISVFPTLAEGNSYKYKLSATAHTLPTDQNDVLSGWSTWDGTAEITATDGYYIAVAELDSDSKIVRTDQEVVTSKINFTAAIVITETGNDITVATTYDAGELDNAAYLVDGLLTTNIPIPAGTIINITTPTVGGTAVTLTAATSQIWISELVKAQNAAAEVRPSVSVTDGLETFIYNISGLAEELVIDVTAKVVVSKDGFITTQEAGTATETITLDADSE